MDGGVGGTTSVHLLDDGFQHRGLRREVDVVLVTAEDLQDALLPAGNLREPLAALARANAVVVRDEEWEQVTPRVCGLMRSGAPIWRVRRELRSAEKIARPIAFCAIARPEGFFAMLRAAGCELVETVAFGDHYKYYMADMERMVTTARERGASGFLTTEKDWVKLSREMVVKLESVGPLCAVALDAKFVNEADVASDLEALLK